MKRPRINNQILAPQMRVVDEEGKNLGVLELIKARELAREKGLDLIEISPTANPPVAKIMDFGKFLYKEKRDARGSSLKVREPEMKDVRVHLGTSEHDLALKAKKASEFLKDGHHIKISLFLKGREKYLDKNFLKERLGRVLKLISENYRIISDVKNGPRGLFIIIERSK